MKGLIFIGDIYKGSKVVDLTKRIYIGYTQDNMGVHVVLKIGVILNRPIKTIMGNTCNLTLYQICGTNARLTDVIPRIHHK